MRFGLINSLNKHMQLSNGARGLNIDLRLHLRQLLVCLAKALLRKLECSQLYLRQFYLHMYQCFCIL